MVILKRPWGRGTLVCIQDGEPVEGSEEVLTPGVWLWE